MLARDDGDRLEWQPVATVRERGGLDVVMTVWLHEEEPPPGLYRAERDDGSWLEVPHSGALV